MNAREDIAPRPPVPLLLAGLALLFVPGLAQPFSTPKLALLALSAALLSLLALRGRAAGPRLPRLLALLWLLLTLASALAARDPAPGALLLDASAALLLVALLSLRWDGAAALRSIGWIGAAVALPVLVQFFLPGPRVRMFGTLGNPDFCAAWMGAGLCAALAHARERRGLLAAAALQAAALACIGSFATLVALAAAAVAVRPRFALPAIAAGALCAAAAGRDPVRAVEGRLYLHRVASPHLLDAPLLGVGQGGVRARWPAWEAERWSSGGEREGARSFAAPQDHVHDDWLERAIETGFPATLALALLAALALRRARREPGLAAAAAGIASLAARAFFDFPLARPAELALFVTLIALPFQEDECKGSP